MNHVLCGLAANTALPSELVDRLIAVADADIAWHLADRADLSRAQALALTSRVEESAAWLAYAGRLTPADIDPSEQPDAALSLLAKDVGCPEWARLLATDPVPERRKKLAACPGLPPDVVRTLSTDPAVRVVAELASATTPAVTAELAAHPHVEVRRAVASNEATPPAVLAALLTGEGLPPAQWCLVCERHRTTAVDQRQHPLPDHVPLPDARCDGAHESAVHDIRQMTLSNPATPADAVTRFADHPSALLRWALATRTDLSSRVYERLAVDPDPCVRADLAQNPALEDDLIRLLADDHEHGVRRDLAHHPRVPLDVLVRLAAGNTRLGPTVLPRIAAASTAEVEELAQSRDPAARKLVAQRRDLPARIRQALAADPDAKVVKAIAPHPGLSEAQLRAMVDRHGVRVVAKVAANPDASPTLLEDLTRYQPPVRKALREIARHPRATVAALRTCLTDPQARPLAAGHPALPPHDIVELIADTDWQVVEAATSNSSLPLAVMSDLIAQRCSQ
ncbi:hypothetical protein [Streptomyces sp. NPDC046939]|uniref:hypothetical protein n=1 Tax=Streptomyces sp. NPDC046939 TaxID=3155376 RepID=UPI0033DE59B7